MLYLCDTFSLCFKMANCSIVLLRDNLITWLTSLVNLLKLLKSSCSRKSTRSVTNYFLCLQRTTVKRLNKKKLCCIKVNMEVIGLEVYILLKFYIGKLIISCTSLYLIYYIFKQCLTLWFCCRTTARTMSASWQ